MFAEAIRELVNHPEVLAIVESVRAEYGDICSDWTWTKGGCFAIAEAIVAAVPKAELWAVGTFEGEDWASEHAFVRYKGRYYDADGESTEEVLLAKYGHPERGAVKIGKVDDWVDLEEPDALWYPEQEFVTEEEIALMTKLFKRILAKC